MKKNRIFRSTGIAVLCVSMLGAGGCGYLPEQMAMLTEAGASRAEAKGGQRKADSSAVEQREEEIFLLDEPDLTGKNVVMEAETFYDDGGYYDNMALAVEDGYTAAEAMGYFGYYEPERPVQGETYEHRDENGFCLARTEPLSTFSADVDTASYANVRRMIEDGYTLDELTMYAADAVRPEEFVNYFSYDLNQPEEGEVFGVTARIGDCPWNEKHQLLMLGLATEKVDLAEAPPENLTFLLDVSGSMADNDKLPLLQRAFLELVDQLDEEDTVSIVTYADGVETLLDSVSGGDKKEIRKAIQDLEASGGTYGEGGIQRAYELAHENYREDSNNRIILATDGDLNIGVSDPDELEKLIRKEKDGGIYLSVLGFGTGNIRDDNMERLADCGNGNYSYIDSILEARKVLVEEMGANFHTAAEDVKLQVEFNPAVVNAYRLIGYENRLMDASDFRDDSKDAGEIGAGHTVVALYELIPEGSEEAVDLKYQPAPEGSGEYATLHIRYKEPGQDTAEEREVVIGEEAVLTEEDEDFAFASMAAELAMILQDSQQKGSASLEQVADTLKALDLDDEYKEEMYYLVKQLIKRQ